MRAIQKGFAHILHTLQSRLEVFQSIVIESPHGFSEISKGGFLGEIQLWALVITNDPGKDGITGQIMKGPSRGTIQGQ